MGKYGVGAPTPLNMQKGNDNSLLKRIFTFHTFQIIFFTFSHTQIQILARHGKKWAWTNVVSLFFTYLFSIFPTHISILQGSWEKMGLDPLISYTLFPSPNPNFDTFWEKMVLKPNRPNIHLWQLVCLGTAYANGIWYKYDKYYYKYYYKYNICCLEILDRSNTHTR